MQNLNDLITRAEGLIDKLALLLPSTQPTVDWSATAWRWVMANNKGYLQAITHPHQIQLANIHFVDAQKTEIVRNTRQFLAGFSANNVLLTGARGTGKSSLIKALLTEFSAQGLRLIEIEKQDVRHLAEIVQQLRERPEKFIIFCDDLTFEANDDGYKALKVVLDGSIAHTSDNVLVYATSNRKHLIPEMMADNLATQHGLNANGRHEIRPSDTVEEKTSLSERFGLWLSFYSFDQDEYLQIAANWLKTFDLVFDESARKAALDFSLTRGARSGRIAYQFARDYSGKIGLAQLLNQHQVNQTQLQQTLPK
ncbi:MULTISPECIES: ATP-binding protein [Methylotenera]|uniref:ATP-binding protein n=1 Tax=Methylotenera TaxID=359407 RepID=UPI00035DC38A|nr:MULTISPECIES: ATP-binding protein [Methylotenera]